MNKEIIAKLKAEATSLRQRLEAIDAVLTLYSGKSTQKNNEKSQKPHRSGGNSLAGRVIELCLPIIEKSGSEPVPTRDLLDELEKQGITIGGKKPIANLSAILSTSGHFNNKNRLGWVTKNNDEKLPYEDLSDDDLQF